MRRVSLNKARVCGTMRVMFVHFLSELAKTIILKYLNTQTEISLEKSLHELAFFIYSFIFFDRWPLAKNHLTDGVQVFGQ